MGSWTNLVGECVEKQCPSFTFESGGVEISFKAAKQGTGEVTKKCPKTHHGEVKSTCEPESELWSPMSGECKEKECPRETIENGGASILFPAVTQGYGKVTIECPKTHHGKVTMMCGPESDAWSAMAGKCV